MSSQGFVENALPPFRVRKKSSLNVEKVPEPTRVVLTQIHEVANASEGITARV